MRFICSKCDLGGIEGVNLGLKYLDFIEHIKYECPSMLKSCPSKNCNLSLTKESLKTHLLDERCKYSIFKCPNCKDEITHECLKNHICFKDYKIQILEKEMELL